MVSGHVTNEKQARSLQIFLMIWEQHKNSLKKWDSQYGSQEKILQAYKIVSVTSLNSDSTKGWACSSALWEFSNTGQILFIGANVTVRQGRAHSQASAGMGSEFHTLKMTSDQMTRSSALWNEQLSWAELSWAVICGVSSCSFPEES